MHTPQYNAHDLGTVISVTVLLLLSALQPRQILQSLQWQQSECVQTDTKTSCIWSRNTAAASTTHTHRTCSRISPPLTESYKITPVLWGMLKDPVEHVGHLQLWQTWQIQVKSSSNTKNLLFIIEQHKSNSLLVLYCRKRDFHSFLFIKQVQYGGCKYK